MLEEPAVVDYLVVSISLVCLVNLRVYDPTLYLCLPSGHILLASPVSDTRNLIVFFGHHPNPLREISNELSAWLPSRAFSIISLYPSFSCASFV